MSDTHLRSVGDDEASEEMMPSSNGLPDFEGQPVDFTRLKLGSASDLEVEDQINHIDDLVRLYVEGRVTRIDHVVDKATGKLKRVHTVTVVDAIQLPWDFDTGAFRD